MHQYYITSKDLVSSSDDDCYLAPDDPIHALKATSCIGGIGSAQALAAYNQASLPKIASCNKGEIQRQRNIKPGSPEWFKLWYGPNEN
jgi:hypothetical protein